MDLVQAEGGHRAGEEQRHQHRADRCLLREDDVILGFVVETDPRRGHHRGHQHDELRDPQDAGGPRLAAGLAGLHGITPARGARARPVSDPGDARRWLHALKPSCMSPPVLAPGSLAFLRPGCTKVIRGYPRPACIGNTAINATSGGTRPRRRRAAGRTVVRRPRAPSRARRQKERPGCPGLDMLRKTGCERPPALPYGLTTERR